MPGRSKDDSIKKKRKEITPKSTSTNTKLPHGNKTKVESKDGKTNKIQAKSCPAPILEPQPENCDKKCKKSVTRTQLSGLKPSIPKETNQKIGVKSEAKSNKKAQILSKPEPAILSHHQQEQQDNRRIDKSEPSVQLGGLEKSTQGKIKIKSKPEAKANKNSKDILKSKPNQKLLQQQEKEDVEITAKCDPNSIKDNMGSVHQKIPNYKIRAEAEVKAIKYIKNLIKPKFNPIKNKIQEKEDGEKVDECSLSSKLDDLKPPLSKGTKIKTEANLESVPYKISQKNSKPKPKSSLNPQQVNKDKEKIDKKYPKSKLVDSLDIAPKKAKTGKKLNERTKTTCKDGSNIISKVNKKDSKQKDKSVDEKVKSENEFEDKEGEEEKGEQEEKEFEQIKEKGDEEEGVLHEKEEEEKGAEEEEMVEKEDEAKSDKEQEEEETDEEEQEVEEEEKDEELEEEQEVEEEEKDEELEEEAEVDEEKNGEKNEEEERDEGEEEDEVVEKDEFEEEGYENEEDEEDEEEEEGEEKEEEKEVEDNEEVEEEDEEEEEEEEEKEQEQNEKNEEEIEEAEEEDDLEELEQENLEEEKSEQEEPEQEEQEQEELEQEEPEQEEPEQEEPEQEEPEEEEPEQEEPEQEEEIGEIYEQEEQEQKVEQE